MTTNEKCIWFSTNVVTKVKKLVHFYSLFLPRFLFTGLKSFLLCSDLNTLFKLGFYQLLSDLIKFLFLLPRTSFFIFALSHSPSLSLHISLYYICKDKIPFRCVWYGYTGNVCMCAYPCIHRFDLIFPDSP